MKKRLLCVALALALVVGMGSCSPGVSQADYDKVVSERDALQSQLDEMREAESKEDVQSQVEEVPEKEEEKSPVVSEPDVNKFEGISISVTEKNNIQQRYNEFIELVYVVTNDTDKEIKGIEGTMRVKDMFGKAIINIGWDVLEPVSANSSQTFAGTGLDYNQFMDDHQKLYSTNFDALIFEYEIKTVIFADGTTIK